MILYGYWRSSASWRVRIALEQKGLAYEYVPVHLVEGGGQQHGEAHRARNPMRQVPVLEVDGRQLTQSMAIFEFLEETHPEPAMLPKAPFVRARVRQFAEICNSGIQPLHNLGVLQQLRSVGADDKAWAKHWVERGLVALEALAVQTAGSRCVGDQVTFADACLVPQLYAARRFGASLDPYPTLTRIEASLAELPAFQRAHADAQPDAVR